MTVGERIKEVRQRIGLSQVDFADKINVSKQTLYKYENNIITNIPSDKVEAAAVLGGVSPAYLMGWEDRERSAMPLEAELMTSFSQLNPTNKKKSVTYTKNLLSAQQMEEELLAAHARTDVDPNPDGVQNDLDIMADDRLWD